MPDSNCCLVTTSSPRSAASNRRERGFASPLSVGRPSAVHFWKPPSRIATCSRAEMAEHEPAARGGPRRRIVVDDDAVVAADAEPLHRRAELLRRRQHVRRRVRLVGDRVDVEEARAGDVAGEIFVVPAAAGRGHVPAGSRRWRGRARRDARPASRWRRASPCRARIGLRAALLLGGAAMETTHLGKASALPASPERGGARLCAQPAAGRALPGALRRARVHLAVPGHRPARFRASGDRLCAGRDDRREQEPEAVPRRRSATIAASTRT